MLKVNVADTLHALERGLMFVDDLPQDEGMLFIFPQSRVLNFWGRNTFIPLDIAFINDKLNVVKIAKIKPMCMIGVNSVVSCKFAIEVNDGYFAKNKVVVGNVVQIHKGTLPGEAFIRFVSNNNEGSASEKQKDNEHSASNTKQSQLAPDVATSPMPSVPEVPIVNKPGGDTVGSPIAETPPMMQLPVLTKGDIGRILEDSFDDWSTETPSEEPTVDDTQPSEQEYPQFQTAFEAMQWAEENTEVIHISYTTKKGRQLERDVEPHGQFHSDSTSRQIAVTFDESVGDVRAFIISNIGSWKFVGKKFTKKFVVKG